MRQAGACLVRQAGACLVWQAGACLVRQAGACLVWQAGACLVRQAGACLVWQAGASLEWQAGASLEWQAGACLVRRASACLVWQAGACLVRQASGSLMRQANASPVHDKQRRKDQSVRSQLIIAAASAAFLTIATAAQGDAGPQVADYTLPNGLELVVIPDRRAPVVTHMIWYRVGAADETPGKSGVAHFLEHLMFKGTAKNPAGKFSQVVARIGGQENAFTAQDYTGYFQRVPSEHLKTVMEFEADRMT